MRTLAWCVVLVLAVSLPVSPADATPPPPVCGVDLAAPQIGNAVARLRPAFADQDTYWNPTPFAGNFDPCLPLSTALVTVERATGSSPVHAVFFHYGHYLGTATWTPYPFTTLDESQTTADTVVLDYKIGDDVCTACPGPIHTVRYLWTGTHVEMLDPPPSTGARG